MSPSSAHRSGAGRILLLLIVLVGMAAAVLLLVANPFGDGDAVDRGAGDESDPDLIGANERLDPDLREEDGGLEGRYGEEDLGGIRLRLLDVETRSPLPGESLRLVARLGNETTALTDAVGIGRFQRLIPGRGYRLDVTVEGYAPLSLQGVSVLRGRETDLGDIVLGRNVVLRGRVIDGSGRPLPGASVAVYTPNRGLLVEGFMFSMIDQVTSFPEPVEGVLSDEDGWFTLSQLRDGVYRLEARLAGYAKRYQSDIVVSQDRPARHMTIVLGEAATVTGRVKDEQGRAVSGARVVAVRDPGRRFFSSAPVERDVARTDAQGRYVMDTLTRGQSYRFGVMADGYAPIFEMTAMEISEEGMEKDFQLARGGHIVGRVVRKEDGAPVVDADVVVAVGRFGFGGRGGGRRGNSGSNNDAEAAQRAAAGRARTDENGEFRIENLLPGPIMSAQAKASGYVTFTGSMWMGNGWGDVVAGEELAVSVELEAGGIVQGVITDENSGEPILGADVSVLPRQGMFMAMMGGSPHTTTDADGRYLLSGVRAGEYGVIAVAPGYAATSPTDQNATVKLPEAGGSVTKNLELNQAGAVTGIVTDSNGEPIAGARVRTQTAPRTAEERAAAGGGRGRRGMDRIASLLPGGTAADLTDQAGRFVIEGIGSDRRWILVAEADEFVQAESEPFRVDPGDVREVNLLLSGGGGLAGRVVDDQGRFVDGARVRLGHIPPQAMTQGRLSAWEADRYLDSRVFFSDGEGQFLATNLPPGATLVKVECEGFVTYYKRNVTIVADQTIDSYMIPLTRGEVMQGVVRGADGRPLEGAIVAVTSNANPGVDPEDEGEPDENVEPRMSARSGNDGSFRIENIPPGIYSVVIWFAPGHKGWARDRDENAVRRGIDAGAGGVEFRLTASTPGSGFPGGGSPRR